MTTAAATREIRALCLGRYPRSASDVGGAWSTYWYNGFLHESNINEGRTVFRFSGREMASQLRLSHLNPQTRESTLP